MSATNSPLVSAIISTILSCLIFATLRFYADWFNSDLRSQINIMAGGFIGSWLFVFSLTAVSNIETIVFGNGFQAKFIPEIIFCQILAVVATGVVHRVCATSCILFSIVGLYFINRISHKCHYKAVATAVDTQPFAQCRNKAGKKHK